jgi:hypothetical protein
MVKLSTTSMTEGGRNDKQKSSNFDFGVRVVSGRPGCG